MLHVHRASRADVLVAPLAELLTHVTDDPFTPELLSVPTKGVERWLAQRLSHHLGAGPHESGICADVRFDSPGRVVATTLQQVRDNDGADDAWSPENLTWVVLEVIDAARDEPWAVPIARYLGVDDETRAGRRFSLARHVAELFASYSAQRPELPAAWAAGQNTDGWGGMLPADLHWQAHLWRRVRDVLDVPDPGVRLAAELDLLRREPHRVELPSRLGVFGATRLTRTALAVFTTLASARDVHLWLVHPSPRLWARVAEAYDTGGVGGPRRRSRAVLARHPLLASMAADAVELQIRLRQVSTQGDTLTLGDTEHPSPAPPATLLGTLQAAIAADEPVVAGAGLRAVVPDSATPGTDPGDHSIQVHACHGRARQVEVLRDVLTGIFADEPTLQPRDVVVLCPDIEAFAPLVTAVFEPVGDGTEHPGRSLRVQLADRSLRRTNPCLDLVGRLLDLADSRVTAPEVLDLAGLPGVRRRFRFDDDEFDRIRAWTIETGVRWGEGAGRRARFGLDGLRQGTWDAALDRILLGAAMAEEDDRFIGSALPVDDVSATDVDLAGRLAEFLARLTDLLARLDGVSPLPTWLDALDDALTLLVAVPRTEDWQLVQARAVLADLRERVEGSDSRTPCLRRADVRDLLADRLRGRPTRAGFRTGALTVCSLEPMRAIPHRVVCLLGMDDGVFPRAPGADGDDILGRDPGLGERDLRAEDRQLFLDAVMAAQDTLVVCYSGADERTGASKPPAVPVAELLDAVNAVSGDAGASVVVRHPLQPVDARVFTPGALGQARSFGYDPVAFKAAVAAQGPAHPTPSLLGAPLPVLHETSVPLEDVVRSLEHPAKWFLETRARIALTREVPDVEDRLALVADPLTEWAAGDRLLAARLAGRDPDRAVAAEWRRGHLPPRYLGAATLARINERVDPIAAAARPWLVGAPATIDVTADLPQGIPVVGNVAGVHELDKPTLVRAVVSRLSAKHRLRAWIQVLALAVASPDRAWQAVTIGRAPTSRARASVSILTAPPPALAAQRLQDLLTLRARGARAPLPLPAYAASVHASARSGGTPEPAALEQARLAFSDRHEDADDCWLLCLGENEPFRALLEPPAKEDASWASRLGESTRFGVLSRRVWDPLLAAEDRRTA